MGGVIGETACMAERFDDETLALLDATEEVDVETTGTDGTVHRTIIWVMVEGADVYVRSVRGRAGRWYRELTRTEQGALRVDGRRIAVRAIPATDERSIAACNEALRRKYEGIPGYEPMLREDTLETTLRLVPADG